MDFGYATNQNDDETNKLREAFLWVKKSEKMPADIMNEREHETNLQSDSFVEVLVEIC